MPQDLFGDALPPGPAGKRPKAKKKSNDADCVIDLQRIHAITHNPDTYALATTIPDVDRDGPGRPSDFPLYVYVLFAALTGVFRSARATSANMRHPAIWAIICEGIADCLGQEEADALPPLGPTRNQWIYNRRTKLLPYLNDLLERFRDLAYAQALEHGFLNPDAPANWSDPDLTQLVVGDGTVPKSPSKYRRALEVDQKSGQITRRRVDEGAGLHVEAGDEKRKVWGPKFVFLSARSKAYFDRVILDLRYQAPRHPGGEAALATEALLELFERAAGCLGVIYDGAPRGVHRDAISKVGRLCINKQHGSAAPIRLPALTTDRCHHDLWAAEGRVAERVITDNGTSVLRPVPIQRLEHRESAKTHRWYHALAIDCRHGTHLYRTRIDQNPEHTKRKINTCEVLRQIPPGTAVFDRLYRHRPDSESVNAQLDATWRDKRIIAYGSDRQTLAMLGFALAQNSIARDVRIRRIAAERASKVA